MTEREPDDRLRLRVFANDQLVADEEVHSDDALDKARRHASEVREMGVGTRWRLEWTDPDDLVATIVIEGVVGQ